MLSEAGDGDSKSTYLDLSGTTTSTSTITVALIKCASRIFFEYLKHFEKECRYK